MRLLILLLLSIGWLLSGYLLLRHFELRLAPDGAAGAGVCEAVTGVGCDAALQSALATWGGLPLAGWGLAFYGTLAVLAVIAAVFGRAIAGTLDRWALAIAALGALASVALLGAMLRGIAPFCPLCCGLHLVNLLLAAVWFRVAGRRLEGDRSERPGVMPAVQDEARAADLELGVGVKLLGVMAALLAGLATGLWVLLLTLWFPAGDDPQSALASFALQPRWEIPVAPEDPRLGAEQAPVQLVVFSDFQCESCRRVARDLHQLRAETGDQVSLVFKHYPLGSACNPNVRSDVHPLACDAARMAEAARRQGQFWDFHDMVFEGVGLVGISPDRVSQQTGVDKERLEADMRLPEVATRIRENIDLGMRLGVAETPAVFIGGRRAPGTSREILRVLIDAERANATRKTVARSRLEPAPMNAAAPSP